MKTMRPRTYDRAAVVNYGRADRQAGFDREFLQRHAFGIPNLHDSIATSCGQKPLAGKSRRKYAVGDLPVGSRGPMRRMRVRFVDRRPTIGGIPPNDATIFAHRRQEFAVRPPIERADRGFIGDVHRLVQHGVTQFLRQGISQRFI